MPLDSVITWIVFIEQTKVSLVVGVAPSRRAFTRTVPGDPSFTAARASAMQITGMPLHPVLTYRDLTEHPDLRPLAGY